jgi:hypothetical protein
MIKKFKNIARELKGVVNIIFLELKVFYFLPPLEIEKSLERSFYYIF